MAVYINASGRISAKNCKNRTASQLGQSVDLPYFSAFDAPLLDLETLCRLLDNQLEQCVSQAGWRLSDLVDIPILLGSTAYTISDCEYRFAHQQPLPTALAITEIGRYFHQKYGSKVMNFATSCTSSAQAIGYGTKMIEQGKCEKALILGFETFNRLTFEHFYAMGLLATSQAEQGIILGEGIGCIALSNQPSDCEIIGVASLTDHHSLTQSSEAALERLVEQILSNASCSSEHISAVKPYLVGGHFDEAEQALLQKLLPNRPLFLPKKQLGHTLGASGTLETAWLVAHLQKNQPTQPLAILNYFLGFGGSHIGWVLQWK